MFHCQGLAKYVSWKPQVHLNSQGIVFHEPLIEKVRKKKYRSIKTEISDTEIIKKMCHFQKTNNFYTVKKLWKPYNVGGKNGVFCGRGGEPKKFAGKISLFNCNKSGCVVGHNCTKKKYLKTFFHKIKANVSKKKKKTREWNLQQQQKT